MAFIWTGSTAFNGIIFAISALDAMNDSLRSEVSEMGFLNLIL